MRDEGEHQPLHDAERLLRVGQPDLVAEVKLDSVKGVRRHDFELVTTLRSVAHGGELLEMEVDEEAVLESARVRLRERTVEGLADVAELARRELPGVLREEDVVLRADGHGGSARDETGVRTDGEEDALLVVTLKGLAGASFGDGVEKGLQGDDRQHD